MHVRTVAVVVALVLAGTVPATAGAAIPEAADDCTFPVERTDATGETVRLDAPPDRIVTLNPSAAQTLWEMDAFDRVVGVTKHASYLEGAGRKENISQGGQTINNEVVTGLGPDLVLATNANSNETVEKLREVGLTVYYFREAESIADISRKTRVIGRLTGECEAADETVSWMRSELATVDEATRDRPRPDVLYAFFDFTAGSGTFIHAIMERAGTNNVAADANITSYQPINDEILVAYDPEWLILNTDWDEVPDSAAYRATTAVETDQIIVVETHRLNQPAPRVVLAIRQIARAVHPEAYAAANATDTPEPETATPTDGGTTTATGTLPPHTTAPPASPAPTEATGPGFTLVAGAVALMGLGLLRRE